MFQVQKEAEIRAEFKFCKSGKREIFKSAGRDWAALLVCPHPAEAFCWQT